jgi:hypothetical protein
MPVSYAETRNLVFHKSALLGRSLFTQKKGNMSRTIKAIERHMIPKSGRIADQTDSNNPTATWHSGLQNESGGTQWKLQLRLPRFRLPAIAAAKC